jgi:hypothetical protein
VPFHAFGVAAEPEEVFGGTGGDPDWGAERAEDDGRGWGVRGRRGGVRVEDPCVFADAAALHGDDEAAGDWADSAEAAWHDGADACGGDGEGAPDERSGFELAAVPDGGGGEVEGFLSDPCVGFGADACEEVVEVFGGEFVEEDWVAGAGGEGWFEDPA